MISKKESYVNKKTYYINTLKTVDYKKYNKKQIKSDGFIQFSHKTLSMLPFSVYQLHL